MNQVFPGIILNIVSLITFFMPASNAIAVALSGFITFCVYFVNMANSLPTQSDYMPDISSYFLSSITLNLISFSWFSCMNRCLLINEMPNWLKKFGESVKKIFCLCFPTEDKKDKNSSDKGKYAFHSTTFTASLS